MIEFYERLPERCDCRVLLDALPREYIEMMTVGIEEVREYNNAGIFSRHLSKVPTRRYVCLKCEDGQIMMPSDPGHHWVFEVLQGILEAEMEGDFKTTMGVGFFIDNRHNIREYERLAKKFGWPSLHQSTSNADINFDESNYHQVLKDIDKKFASAVDDVTRRAFMMPSDMMIDKKSGADFPGLDMLINAGCIDE